MKTTEHPVFIRLLSKAREKGSRAKTPRGVISFLSGLPLEPPLEAEKASGLNRGLVSTLTQFWPEWEAAHFGKWRPMAEVRSRLLGKKGDFALQQPWGNRLTAAERAAIRQHCPNKGNRPIFVLGGRMENLPPTMIGRKHYFRWLGKWKTAPGSYQHSTRKLLVGAKWLETQTKGE
jgi:hypothetical protein